MNTRRVSMMFLLCASMMLASSALAQSEDPSETESTDLTPLTLINGWYNAPYSTGDAAVEKINGIVHFKGAIASISDNQEPFILPKAFRPSHVVYIPVDLCDANNGRLDIQPSGAVYVEAETSFNYAECFTSLDGASFAVNGTGFSGLTLINGWTDTPYGTADPGITKISGVVHFKGAISSSGASEFPFVLAKEYRPSHDVYIPVDMCNATNGRLYIQPNGTVFVQAENYFTNAQCFTSLDGAWFIASDSGAKSISLTNSWFGAPYSTSQPKAEKSNGIVYLQGAIATSGDNSEPFVLPSSFIPEKTVYVPVDLCNATKGRLYIQPNGVVGVEAETSFSNAQCFTSLDGVSFAQ